MTTPTPSHPSNPSSASKRTAGHVSTPSHLNYTSPAPRSMPSPAAMRKEQASKTPINHPTTGSTGGKTLGGTPMLSSLSQQGNPSSTSPSTNLLASFGTPIGLGVGIDGTTPGGGPYMTIPGLGGAAMMPTMSELGLKRNEDEERRVKMRKVLRSIGRPKGRVSEEGIARISRRVGFQNDIDAEKLTAEERERKVGNRSISIAGNKLVLDIELKAQAVQNVQVIFDSEDKGLAEIQAPIVAKVLQNDLTAENGISIHAKLDRFALNLERLASIDRLSSNRVNCFEALSGIYGSLTRLYEQEKRLANELEVMCHKSGRPKIHADGRLGLVIEYWQHRRFARDQRSPDSNGQDDTFRLRVTAESTPASPYPPLRISDSWLPETFELAADDGELTTLPWQDPPPLETNDTNEAMAIDGAPKLSDLHFVAHLEPPIIVEYTVAMGLLSNFGVSAPQLSSLPPFYYQLVTGAMSSETSQLQAASPVITTNDVVTMVDGQESMVTHVNTLYPIKLQEYGWRIDRLPFAHPRQLIDSLPILRQWAQLGCILKTAFDGAKVETSSTSSAGLPGSANHPLTPPKSPVLPSSIAIDVALQCLPQPMLAITFPPILSGEPVTVPVQVFPNGRLAARPEQNVGTEALDGNVDKPATALDRCADLDVWVEWLRTKA